MTSENIVLNLSGLGLGFSPNKHVLSLTLLCGMNAGSAVPIQVDSRGFLVISGTNQ